MLSSVEEIKARKKALIDAAVSQADIVRATAENGLPAVSGSLVNQVMRGKRRSPRVMHALIQKLGAEVVAALWPNATSPSTP